MSCFTGLGAALGQHLGESITVTPYGGVAKVVMAVVFRPTRGLGGGPDGAQRFEYEREILVVQSDYGTLNVGGDAVALKKETGDAVNTTYVVAKLIDSDGLTFLLGLKG